MRSRRRWLEQRLHQVIDRGGGRLETEALCLARLATGQGAAGQLESWHPEDGSRPAVSGVDEGATVGTTLVAITLLELGGDRRRVAQRGQLAR